MSRQEYQDQVARHVPQTKKLRTRSTSAVLPVGIFPNKNGAAPQTPVTINQTQKTIMQSTPVRNSIAVIPS